MWPRSVSLKRVNYEAGIRDNAANVRSVPQFGSRSKSQ